MQSGMISDIQKFSLHDGPGIRTVVFLKGCSMRCIWCQNPESISRCRLLVFYPDRCILCGACYEACKTGALARPLMNAPLKAGQRKYDRNKCVSCFACAGACAPSALKVIGREASSVDVFKTVMQDWPYYRSSGGGVTLSGGEPLLQADFSAEILGMCRRAGLDTAIETNLSLPRREMEKVLPFLDRVYCDLKLIDEDEHIRYTGITNSQVLENLAWLSGADIPLTVRTPLIPGVTDSDANISGIAEWLSRETAIREMELLNYNPLAEAKHRDLGYEYPLAGASRLNMLRIAELRSLAGSHGILARCGAD